MIDKKNVRIGSDFEMFVVDKSGKYISAIPLISGTKEEPQKIEKGCCIQHDGVLAEMNISPVRLDQSKEFWENIEFVKGYIEDVICKPKELELKCCSSAVFTEDQFDCDEAVALGCSVSFNGWKYAEVNEKPRPENPFLRTTGKCVAA